MTGLEYFEFNGKKLDYNFVDFWRFHYSNIYDIQGRIAEFIVAKALDIHDYLSSHYYDKCDVRLAKYKGKTGLVGASLLVNK